jgi:RNA polymerase sigma-70 factor (ECF subfamily)
MTRPSSEDTGKRLAFEKELGELRPKIHRFCSRMAGSAVDGEDIVQEVFIKAVETLAQTQVLTLKSWLFRVAHNAAVDFLRRRQRREALHSEEDPDMTIDETESADARIIAAAGLRTFMYLPIAQRGCVILMDVLGYSLREVADITGLSIPAVKAALHRGRVRIRDVANAEDVSTPPILSQEDLRRLANYVDRFNARDFDAVRDLLADDVRLELVSRLRMEGRQRVSGYFHNYAGVHDWLFVPGMVDRQPAILVVNPNNIAAPPSYIVLLEWNDDDEVASIRDFRHARYVAESAEMIPFGSPIGSS